MKNWYGWRLCYLTAGLAFGQPSEELAWQTLTDGFEGRQSGQEDCRRGGDECDPSAAEGGGMVEGVLDGQGFGVRQAACDTLGDIKSRTSIPKLKTVLDDKAPEVIFAAAKALYAMGDPAGREVLSDILIGDQKDASGFLTASMRDARLKLHDPKALLLVGVNQAAGFLGPAGAGVPVAEQLLKDGQASGKTVAALLLATDTYGGIENAVKAALNDKNWTVRSAAAAGDLAARSDGAIIRTLRCCWTTNAMKSNIPRRRQ